MTPENQMSLEEFHAGAGPAKAPHRVLGGGRAQASGKDYERALDLTHLAYQAAGMALIEKLPVGTKPMPPGWLNRGNAMKAGLCRILAERARFDYFGSLGPAFGADLLGRAVAMEAKKTSKHQASIPIIPKKGDGSGLKEHQLEACSEAWSKFGTLAVVVWCNEEERCLFTPDFLVRAYQEFRLGQRTRVYAEEAHHFKVGPLMGAHAVEDWLNRAVAWFDAQGRKRPA